MLKGKHVLLGVTGSIAAYKAADLVSRLQKLGAEVKVIMTKSATELVAPLTFESLTHNPVYVNMFESPQKWEIEHISLAKWADVFAIAPATANIIAKLACGLADDMLSTVALAYCGPMIVAPAMNTAMFEHVAVAENIKTLKGRGACIVEPEEGRLACGDTGKGKLADVDDILDAILYNSEKNQDLYGQHVLVTAGATSEALDPVRFITNHSSGKMGVEIARAAKIRGAKVTLVAGSVNVRIPTGINVVRVTSAIDMYNACMQAFPASSVIIKAAAVADYRPATYAENKIKKAGNLSLELERNPDILAEMGIKKSKKQTLVGFCMETENLLQNAETKLKNKNLDMIVANHLLDDNAGFCADNNTVTIIQANGECESLPNMSKFCVANEILNRVYQMKQTIENE